MDKYLPQNSFLGKLRIIEVLDWYDGPRLFVSENVIGHRYLSFWADECSNFSHWLYVPISDSRLNKLTSGKLALRSALAEPETPQIFFVKISHQGRSSVSQLSPSELDPEYFPPEDDFLTEAQLFHPELAAITTESQSPSALHQIDISRPRSRKPIPFQGYASIASLWTLFYHSICQFKLLPTSARVASFHLELQAKDISQQSKFFHTLKTVLSDPTVENVKDKLLLPQASVLLQLLQTLKEEKLTLHATIGPDTQITLAPSQLTGLTSSLCHFRQTSVLSAEIPQADDILKVFRLVELAYEGTSREKLSYELAITPRQVAYYRHAARTLDLLDSDNRVTSRGTTLYRLTEVDRLHLASVLFESSPIGLAWINYCGAKSLSEVQPHTAKSFLENQCVNLAPSTIGRRAITLSAWIKAFYPTSQPTRQSSI